ncbi:MAG: 3-isopropylmalate dehydratase large subunit [Rikenellaceae bacterium]
MGKTIIDKIWDSHVVKQLDGGRCVLYIDRHYIHEVTSPQAFSGLRSRGIRLAHPEKTIATADHNTPTEGQFDTVLDGQLLQLDKNCAEFGVTQYFPMGNPYNGIVHIIGPEMGYTRPGMTIVCGDSHTSTHGAFGAIAFGIGTSEVEMVMAAQSIIQMRPKSMRISVEGELSEGVTAKDVALYIIGQLTTSGGTGYFIEFAGSAIRSLSMEGRMTLCNMSIECGARGGIVAPDATTFSYLIDKDVPVDPAWEALPSDGDASFDLEYTFSALDISPMITWGNNPGEVVPLSGTVPSDCPYMGFTSGDAMEGLKIDYAFLGSCTNGRIEDFREFASVVEGYVKHPDVVAWLVPGSWEVRRECDREGLTDILEEAGFELREPGCSACLAMNDDKVPAGKYCVSTSNRNFEGRQGPGSRTLLASPSTVAMACIAGKIVQSL